MKRSLALTAAVLFAAAVSPLHAQWHTESHNLKAGWNAIYPFVDASDVRLIELADARIDEIWRWDPGALDAVTVGSPSEPVTGNEWARWRRGFPEDSTFDRLLPNFGYLVKVTDGPDVTLSLKGKVEMPRVQWRNDGLNLVGFPTATAPAPRITAYLSPGGLVDSQTGIYRYIGGPLGSTPLVMNPMQLPNLQFQTLPRGEAMWIDTGRFSDYYGPIKVEVSLSPDGLQYGDSGTSRQLVLRNRTTRPLTVTLTPVDSETDRDGAALSAVPLLRRVFDAELQRFNYLPLDAPFAVELAAGQTRAEVLVVERSGLSGPAGTVNASILRVTDSDDLSRIDVPVAATVTGLGGLWIGEALIDRVQNQLQQFERDPDTGEYLYQDVPIEIPDPDNEGQTITATTRARIPLAGTGDSGLHATAQTFPIRLIVHVDASGAALLLSNVYAGRIATAVEGAESVFGVATAQSLLDPERLADAVRITSVHFPLDVNTALDGASFGPGASLAGTVGLAHDAKDNPFIHAFHPDHDNLDARFEDALPSGVESHTVNRALTLAFDASNPDAGPAWGTQLLTGTYTEDITGIHKNALSVEGAFFLRRLSDDDVLHTP